LELKKRLPAALHEEVAKQLDLPYPLPKRADWPVTWEENKVETALVFRTFEAALDRSVVANVYTQEKWDVNLEDSIRLKGVYKLMLRFSLKQLQAAQCLRDKLDEELRRAAGLPVWSDRLKEDSAPDVSMEAPAATNATEERGESNTEAKVEDVQPGVPAPVPKMSPPKKRLLIYAPKTDMEKARDKKRKEMYESKGKGKGKGKAEKGKGKGSKGSKEGKVQGKGRGGKKGGGKGRGRK
jgi:hypothetical protein